MGSCVFGAAAANKKEREREFGTWFRKSPKRNDARGWLPHETVEREKGKTRARKKKKSGLIAVLWVSRYRREKSGDGERGDDVGFAGEGRK